MDTILFPALLVVASAPELLRQAQGGDADVPLAIYLGLALLAAVGWIALRNRFAICYPQAWPQPHKGRVSAAIVLPS